MRHQRIERIKKLSESLRLILSLITYGLWLLLPSGLVFPFLGTLPSLLDGKLVFMKFELTLIQSFAISTIIVAFSLFAVYSVRNARDLMAYFSKGEIFNRGALLAAKKAIHCGLAVFAGPVLLKVFLVGYGAVTGSDFLGLPLFPFLTLVPELSGSLFMGGMFFGMMYVLLWALEIGTDLNEESELTI